MNISQPGMPLPGHQPQALSKPSGQTSHKLYLKHIDQPVVDAWKKIGDQEGHRVCVDVTALTRCLAEKQAIMAISGTVRERLSPMGKVVECKRILGQAIFAPSREQKVLAAAARAAQENGIDIERYTAFIKANMNAAKAIQSAHPGSTDHCPPSVITDKEYQAATVQLTQIRSHLIKIGDRMAAVIGAYLKNQGPFPASMGGVFKSHLGIENLPDKNKDELLDKLLAVSAATDK